MADIAGHRMRVSLYRPTGLRADLDFSLPELRTLEVAAEIADGLLQHGWLVDPPARMPAKQTSAPADATISHEQAAELVELMRRHGYMLDGHVYCHGLLAHYRVERLGQLTLRQYDDAKKMIQSNAPEFCAR
jgi:hypothetical protein